MLSIIKKRHKELLFLLFSAIIFIFRIWYIRECNAPAIRNDEYGYWSHAALFSGHDWSDVLSGHMNWYAYGYSLVLTPLFWISHNMRFMYKAAIAINGILGVLSFFICLRCAKMLFPKTKQWMLLTVSFMVSMYSSYITQGSIAWSETFLYFLVWLLFYLFLLFEQCPTTARALLLSVCMGGCYITHNRTIGIVTAYILVVLLLRLSDSIDWKLFAALLLPLALILFLNVNVKTYLCIIEGYGLKPKNGMGAKIKNMQTLLTAEGWWNLIRTFSGQIWCLMTSTFGLLFWGLARCATRVFHACSAKKAERHTVFYMFALLACVGTFLISAISLIDPAAITDLDSDADLSYFIYTRYNECIIGILLLLGFLELANRKKNLKFVLLTCSAVCIYTAMGIILYFNLQRITDTWHYRSFCVAGIGFYRLFSEKFAMRWCVLIGAFGFFALIILLTFYKKRFRSLHIVVSCLLLTAAFIPTGLYSAKIGTINSQLGKVSSGNLAMYELLKKVVGNRDVYCTLDDTKNYRIAYELQVQLIDTHVHSITLEDVPVKEDGYFICCSNGDMDKFQGDDYYMLTQSKYYVLIVKGDALAEEIAPKTEQKLVNLRILNES